MGWRAILFDLDGTLLDTLEDLATSMNTVLTRMGCPDHPVERYRYFVGDGIEMLALRCLAGINADERMVQRCVEGMRQEYGQRWASATRPYDGVPEMLAELDAMGLKMVILSNKPHGMTRKVVEHFFPARFFVEVWGARPEYPKKPDPAGALALAGAVGCLPSEFLYLGDTDIDMKTALAAGMYPVGACWGFRPAEELSAAGARTLAANPRHVVELARRGRLHTADERKREKR